MITLDFETRPITPHRPPPLPVGCAIRWENGVSEYMAWGHRTGNNCTKEQAFGILREVMAKDTTFLFHNAKFDLGVMYSRIKTPPLPWTKLHDTQFLLVLNEPYARDISLKGSAQRLLGVAPTERNEIVDWLLANETQAVVDRASSLGISREDAAKALVWLAPVPLVAKYAIGDVDRTFALFEHLHPKIISQDMGDAYDLERRTLPHLLALELRGLRVDPVAVEETVAKLDKSQQTAAIRIYDKMNTFVDIGSPTLARALQKGKHVTGLTYKPVTKKAAAKGKTVGNISTSKDSLMNATFADPELRELIMYWRGVAYVKSNSFLPWLESAKGGNRIYTDWHQTRGQDAGGEDNGARTLRFSAAWFLNIANERKLKYSLLPGLEKIPSPRSFILPLEGYDKIICRDWSQQEFRIAAHFEDGPLMREYQSNPYMDIHTKVTRDLTTMGVAFERMVKGKWASPEELIAAARKEVIKVFDLAILYGMGLKKTADKANVDEITAKMIRGLIKGTIPGLMLLVKEIQAMEESRGYVCTWKGARLTREPPFRLPDGHVIDFGYKLPNHVIQRSAAETMKEAMCTWHEGGYAAIWPWMMSVHDENNVYSTDGTAREGAIELDRCMRVKGFDVPLVSDLAIGPDWGHLVDMDDPSYNAERFNEAA
jgi:DNA polymerase I-like protein with 3'-5' exonuclease and polymerase domains